MLHFFPVKKLPSIRLNIHRLLQAVRRNPIQETNKVNNDESNNKKRDFYPMKKEYRTS